LPLIDQYGAPLEKAVPPAMPPAVGGGTGGWWPVIREPWTGAWQQNRELRGDSVLNNVTAFRCVSLISTDIAKMRLKLINQVAPGVWEERDNSAWSPVLRRQNHYQNRIQFFENWITSKLNAGNTYVLKERDQRNVVVALYVLDPRRVRVLVSPLGDVFYELGEDDLAGLGTAVRAPASEIIHDRWNCFFHPLVGLSPIFANSLVINQGQAIQSHSAQFYANKATPGGILTAPGRISQETVDRMKADWQERFTGSNAGLVAVLGDGLKFETAGTMNATDSQLIEQLRWTAEAICASYGVPPYKAGAAPAPTLNNIEALERQYYQACLQIHIESIELCVDEGLGLPAEWGVEFDLDALLRMDTSTLIKAVAEGTGAGILEINEARLRLGYGATEGGDAAYLQQQNYSLAALSKRDGGDDPFGKATALVAPPQAPPEPAANEDVQAAFVALFRAKFAGRLNAAV